MGIKDYLKYIPQEQPNAKSRIYDYVYMDCNYMCHYLIYKCKSDIDFYSKIFNYWNTFTDNLKINKEIFLIFDGEYEEEQKLNPKYQTHLLRAKQRQKQDAKHSDDIPEYSTQSICPRSQILKTFREYLIEVIERYKKINKLMFKITTNSDEIYGEADIKILNLIANSNQNNICICSKDSDMILIACVQSIKKSINIDIMSNFRPIQFISVSKFAKYNLDYVAIVLLLGNDYLPKISNIEYNTLIKSYDRYIKFGNPIIINNTLNWNNFVNYVGCVMASSSKKLKFKIENIDHERFNIYANNYEWCLSYYDIVPSSKKYIQEITHKNDNIKLKHVINIFNFINCNRTDV